MPTETLIRIAAFAVLVLLIVLALVSAWRNRGKPRAPEDDQGSTPRPGDGE